jgi:hypothetical protein
MRSIIDYKLFTLKIFFHYESALNEISKENFIGTSINFFIKKSLTFIPKTQAFAAAQKI